MKFLHKIHEQYNCNMKDTSTEMHNLQLLQLTTHTNYTTMHHATDEFVFHPLKFDEKSSKFPKHSTACNKMLTLSQKFCNMASNSIWTSNKKLSYLL